MHCRSVLLLERELQKLKKEPLWGIEVHSVPDNALLYFVIVSGLKDSLWERGKFHVTLQFTEHFDEELPEIIFNTIPFHPNIHPTSGKLCINFGDVLSNLDKPGFTFTNLLLNLQTILSNPILANPVNEEAAKLLENSTFKYEKMVADCVSESVRVQEILHTQFLEGITSSIIKPHKEELKTIPLTSHSDDTSSSLAAFRAKQVSFDVYHKAWAQVATTKSVSRYVAEEQQLALQMWNPDYADVRSISPGSVIRVQNRSRSATDTRRNKTHAVLTNNDRLRQRKVNRVTAMKHLYLNRTADTEEQGTPAPVTSLTNMPAPSSARMENPSIEQWEREADDLVAWTGTLNEDAM